MVAALLAAVAMAAGAWVPRWWTGRAKGVDQGVGLRVVELCAPDACATRGLEDLGSGTSSWPLLGATGFAIAWVAIAFLLAAVVMTATRRGGAWRVRVARAAAACSLFALVIGAAFAWAYPGFAGLGISWAMVAYLCGAAIAVGAGGMLLARAEA
jgi:hypothetical protein